MPLTPQQLAELQRLREMFQPLAAESQRKAKAIENLESVAGPVKLPTDKKAKGGSMSKEERDANLAKFLADSHIKERLYHATPKNFKQFKPGGNDPTLSGPAIWLSRDPHHQPAMHNISGGRDAKFREGVNVMPVHVQSKNPMILDDESMVEWARAAFANGSREFPDLLSPQTVEAIKQEGYDSIVHADPYKTGRAHEVIMLYPNKIKSAIGNRGTYDTTKSDITKADGGLISQKALDAMLSPEPTAFEKAQQFATDAGNRLLDAAIPIRKMFRNYIEPTVQNWHDNKVLADPQSALDTMNYARDLTNETKHLWEQNIRRKLGMKPLPDMKSPELDEVVPNSFPKKAEGGLAHLAIGGQGSKNWLKGNVETALDSLNQSGYFITPSVRDGFIEAASNPNDPYHERMARRVREDEHARAVQKWIDSNLANYVKKQMATPSDPVRKLAEQGILHVDPEEVGINRYRAGEHRQKHGGEQLGESVAAKAWEDATDVALKFMKVKDLGDVSFDYREPWHAKADPETQLTYTSLEPRSLGFDHLVDVLKEDLASGRIRPEKLNTVSIEQAVRRAYEYDQERAKAMAQTAAKNTEGMPVRKEYDSGHKWIELTPPQGEAALSDLGKKVMEKHQLEGTEPSPGVLERAIKQGGEEKLRDAMKYEGDTMGHCVKGESYVQGVLNGQKRIFSLRDAKGMPHVTIETQPDPHPISTSRRGDNFPEFTGFEYGGKYSPPSPYAPTKEQLQQIHNRAKALWSTQGTGRASDVDKFYQKASNEILGPMPERIIQIKGKQNRKPKDEYIPFVQDFVKSGKWSDVGDLQNTGLYSAKDVVNYMPEGIHMSRNARTLAIGRAKMAGEMPDYLTRDEYGALLQKHVPEDVWRYEKEKRAAEDDELLRQLRPPQERMAHGGKVHMATGGDVQALDQMRLELSKNGMYSPLEKAAINVPRTKGTAAEFMTEASKQPGFRQEEVADRKIQFPEGKLTKQQFVEHLKKNSLPPLQEKVLKDYGDSWEGGYDKAAQEMFRMDYDDLDNDDQQRVRDHWQTNGTQYGDYQMPGGTNYREMLLKLPKRKPDANDYTEPADYDRDMRAFVAGGQDEYHSKHWKDPNVLAHLRLSDRRGPNGENLLHVEELQSDWHQEGRKMGYKTGREEQDYVNYLKDLESKFKNDAKSDYLSVGVGEERAEVLADKMAKRFAEDPRKLADYFGEDARAKQMALHQARMIARNALPDAPFKKSWHEMALKHVLHHAAKNGYEGIVITPGAEQADRYDLSKQINDLQYDPETKRLSAWDHSGNQVVDKSGVSEEELPDYIGKEGANKLLAQNPQDTNVKQLFGADLKVGGEGMKGFYDKIVPDYLNKLGKKHGVKVQPMKVQSGHEFLRNAQGDITYVRMPKMAPVHYFPIPEPMRQSILKEGLPQYQRGGIIHKAQGGAVISIEQMRNELMNKVKFKSLSDLQSVGANEAPSLGVKAYVPTIGRPDNNEMPVGGVDTHYGDLPIGGIDMSKMQPGQQFMPQAGNQPGMDQTPQGDRMPSIDGTSMPPTPNTSPAPIGNPQSSILQLTPQGQALAAMGGNQPPKMARGGKVEVKPTVFDDKASRRHHEIETALKALQAGIIKPKEYERIVQKHKPVKPYDFVPKPASDEEALSALSQNKHEGWRSHEDWPEGHPVGLRLDIPAYENHGVWVNSIHDEQGGKDKFPTSYGAVSSVKNATFEGKPEKAVRVGTGEQNKAPFARIKGELHHMTKEEAVEHMVKHLKHKDWRQVGYDPRRHGDFYDRETMQPVTHAEHVIQIGPLVLAKKPKYGKRTMYASGGSASSKKPLHYEPAEPLSKSDIEAHAERMSRQIAGLENPNKKSLQQLAREQNLPLDIKSGGKKMNVPIINYEDLKDAYTVGVPGDPSRGGVVPTLRKTKGIQKTPKAGEYLRGIGGEKLENRVGMYGGKDYGAYGHPAGWASDLGASAGMFNVVKRLAEENPDRDIYGHYHKMSPESLYHAVHMLDAVISHIQPHKASPEHIAMLNDLMRNVKTTTDKNDVPYPEFPGFENPQDVMLHGALNSGMRKKIINILGKEKYFPGGKQKLDDIIYAITHPELRNVETGAGGSSVIKFDPSRDLRQSISPHPTYGHDIPSTLEGRTRYTTPFEILAPRSYSNAVKEIKAMGKRVDPFNMAKMNIIREPIDEQYINQMGEYEHAMRKRLGYKAGGKVKLSKDMDIINLELSKSRKKAK